MSLICGLENTLESTLDSKRLNQIILKEISPELEGLMLKLKLQYFGHLMWTTDPDSGKDGRQEEKGMTEDDMVGWHHRLDGHKFEQAPGVGDGQRSLAYCSPWGRRVGHDWAVEQHHLYLVGGENSERKWQYLRKHLQAKATCLPVGILGKESYRKMGAHCAWQRSCLLSSKMKHSLETIPSSQVTRHQGSLAKEARPCLVAFQRYMSSRVFKSEPNWGERARFRNATLTQN